MLRCIVPVLLYLGQPSLPPIILSASALASLHVFWAEVTRGCLLAFVSQCLSQPKPHHVKCLHGCVFVSLSPPPSSYLAAGKSVLDALREKARLARFLSSADQSGNPYNCVYWGSACSPVVPFHQREEELGRSTCRGYKAVCNASWLCFSPLGYSCFDV